MPSAPLSSALACLALAVGCASLSPSPAATTPASSAAPAPKVKASGTSNQIQLVSFAFDPAAGFPDVPADLRAPDPGIYLVQLAETSSPRGHDLDAIKSELGLSLSEYIPNRTYREYLSPQAAERLRDDPRIRTVASYLPAYKISASLLAQSSTDPDRVTGGLVVLASPNADPTTLQAALTNLGAGTVTQPTIPAGYPMRFFIADAKASAVRHVANVQGTVWIEEATRIDEDDG